MPIGMIKAYNAKKGFGFIAYERGADIFFHISTCGIENPESLAIGRPVNFEIVQGKKGQEARQLTIEKEAPPDLTQKLRNKLKKPKKKNFGELYIEKQIKFSTPMVFEAYSESIKGIVAKDFKYEWDLLCGEEKRRIKKLDVLYCYKTENEQAVKASIIFDESIKSQALQPIKPKKERCQIPNELLLKSRKEKKPIRLVLRGGEIILGTVRWFSPYEIKVEFPSGGNVIVFRHAALDFSISDEDKPKGAPQKVEEEGEKVVKVSITSEQAAQGVRVSIPIGDQKKFAIRLPAGVSDGKRFKIKGRNMLVVVSVRSDE